MVGPGNFMQIYLKQWPSFLRAFTNCLMMPSFMWRGGNTIVERSTKGGARTLRELGIRSLRRNQCFFIRALFLPCCPTNTRSKEVLCSHLVARGETQLFFKSTHKIHWFCLYESFSRTNYIFSYFSLRVVEWPRGTDSYKFPLWRRTHFKLLLELSIKKRQSWGSYWYQAAAAGRQCRCNILCRFPEWNMARIQYAIFYWRLWEFQVEIIVKMFFFESWS